MGDVILTMKGIDKSFPGVHALDHVDLEIRKGEVLALMGENGAGKSTLMKILTGVYSKDSGTITYEGKEVEFKNTREAQDAGVVIVHQELNMSSTETSSVPVDGSKVKSSGSTPSHAAKSPADIAEINAFCESSFARTLHQAFCVMQCTAGT